MSREKPPKGPLRSYIERNRQAAEIAEIEREQRRQETRERRDRTRDEVAADAARAAYERGDEFFVWEQKPEGFTVIPSNAGREVMNGIAGRELAAIEGAGWTLAHMSSTYSTSGAVVILTYVFRRKAVEEAE